MRYFARIYVLIDPITEEVRYVGKTENSLACRLRSHLKASVKGGTHVYWWISGLIKKGMSPKIRLVERVLLKDWADAEIYWIKFFKTAGAKLTNLTDGGCGSSYIHSDD